MPSGRQGRWIRAANVRADWLAVVLLPVAYAATFGSTSAIHSPAEIFAQDSGHILGMLAAGLPYFGANSHILYHVLVEGGYDAWQSVFAGTRYAIGEYGAFVYLKLFSAGTAVAFLVVLRKLLAELDTSVAQRTALLVVSGAGVSAWFNFAGFETHSLAMAPLAAYLLASVRLLRDGWSAATLWLFVVSLVLLALARIDLARFAGASLVLLATPQLQRSWRIIAAAFVTIVVLTAFASAVLVSQYRDTDLSDSFTDVLERDDRGHSRFGRTTNLTAENLATIVSATTIYTFAMPVPIGFLEDDFELAPDWRYEPVPGETFVHPKLRLFSRPVSNLLASATGIASLAAVILLFSTMTSALVVASNRPIVTLLFVQALAGWSMYTWWAPSEPFLWTLEFLPLYVVLLAIAPKTRLWWVAMLSACVALPLHNYFAFYLAFR